MSANSIKQRTENTLRLKQRMEFSCVSTVLALLYVVPELFAMRGLALAVSLLIFVPTLLLFFCDSFVAFWDWREACREETQR